MKTKRLIKNLAKKISLFENPEYGVVFLDAESIIKIAIQEYGYEQIQRIQIGELIEGVEKNIPADLTLTKRIIISKEY